MNARFIRSLSPLAVAVALFVAHNATAQETSNNDRTAVEQANEKYIAALNAMFAGDPAPFQDVWWHTDDVIYMGTNGTYTVGWEEIDTAWKQKAAQKLGGKATAEDVRTTVAGDMAVTSQYIVAAYEIDGELRELEPRATSVFQKKNGQWRMICHHVDVAPTLKQ